MRDLKNLHTQSINSNRFTKADLPLIAVNLAALFAIIIIGVASFVVFAAVMNTDQPHMQQEVQK